MSIGGVHLVTARGLKAGALLVSAVADAVSEGVSAVHVREPDLPANELYVLAGEIRDAIAGRAPLIVNDRIDVALAVGARGVQLGERSLPVSVVRGLVGRDMIIGRSVHDLEGARRAELEGADFLLAGTIYPSRSHPDRVPAGLRLLRDIRSEVSIPVIAIGGIDATNAAETMSTGVDGIAVISAILASGDVRGAARELVHAVATFTSGIPPEARAREGASFR